MARGGAREGAGRKPGSVPFATQDERLQVARMAREHTELALNVLVEVARGGESEAARVAAATTILDRGYGRCPQGIQHEGPGGGGVPFYVVTGVSDPV